MESEKERVDIKARITKLILRVGDEGRKYYRRDLLRLLDSLSQYVANDTKREISEWIALNLAEAVCHLPNKGLIYAVEVALLSIKHLPIVEQLIDRIFSILQAGLNEGDLQVPKNCLIFFGELMNLGLLNSYNYLHYLFDLSKEAERTLETTRYYYLELIVKVLPACSQGLMSKITDEYSSFVNAVRCLMKRLAPDSDLAQVWALVEPTLANKEQDPDTRAIFAEFTEELDKLKQIQKAFKRVIFKDKSTKVCFESPPAGPAFIPPDFPSVIKREYIRAALATFWPKRDILLEKLSFYGYHFGRGDRSDPIFLVRVLFSEALVPVPPRTPFFFSSLILSLINAADPDERAPMKAAFLDCAQAALKVVEAEDRYFEPLTELLAFYLTNTGLDWPW
jgi:hypothetical protein